MLFADHSEDNIEDEKARNKKDQELLNDRWGIFPSIWYLSGENIKEYIWTIKNVAYGDYLDTLALKYELSKLNK
jgi:hypothetical protein